MSDKPKILIVTTHPVQYQVPWFRHLHSKFTEYTFEIIYMTIPDAKQQGTGFGQSFEWDIPLLEGYNWTRVDPDLLGGDKGIDRFMSLRIKKARHLITQHNPDAVILTGWQCLGLIQTLLACKTLKIPCLIRAESNNLKPRSFYKRLLHHLLLKQYNSFLAIGSANRNFYLANAISPENIYPCPYFVDNDFFAERSSHFKKNISSLRKNWNIPQESYSFCYVGKLNPKKRIMDVLQSMRQLASKQVHLLVVGDGELMQQAKHYVDTHRLSVTFAGFLNQSEIAKAYAISNCLILVSDYDETWGLVVNEAMACGLPAIVSDRCGCHLDLVIDNETGYTFEFADIEGLTEKMKKIMSLDELALSTLGSQAKANVTENYSINKASEGLIKALVNGIKTS